MVFDWFRRRYTKEEELKEAAKEQASKPTDQPTEKPAEATPPANAPAQPDYLAFAKAAYANIQARQEQAQPVEADPEESPAPEQPSEPPLLKPLEPELPPNLPVLPPEPDKVDDPGLVDPVPSTSLETAPDKLLEAVAPEPVVAPVEPAPEPLPDPIPEPLPDPIPEPLADPTPKAFFEMAPKAAARLEALQATAVVEPAPRPPVEVEPSPQPVGIEGGSADLTFDAGFLWSAEVLAAQGRRPEEISLEEITWLQKLQQGLGKTRRGLVNQIKSLVGRGPMDAQSVEEVETLLLQADVGVDATDEIIAALQKRLRKEALPPEEAVQYLKTLLREMLDVGNPTFAPDRGCLNIWMIVGVNGAGKTTTIGKMAHIAQKSDYRCLIAAGDTFRAAAVEQLKIWGERAGVEVIANPGQNTDPAAVVFDAVTAAQARKVELLIVDTAGRLQNKKNLMDELTKIRRIVDKKAPQARIESLLVLDATLGQNGLRQAEVFAQAAQLSGVILTKLDSTAKGGVAFAVVKQLGLPIRFIGAGEGIEDLRPFSSYEFVEALLGEY